MEKIPSQQSTTTMLAQIALTVSIILAALCVYLLLELNEVKGHLENQKQVTVSNKIVSRKIEIIDQEGKVAASLGGGKEKEGYLSINGQKGEAIRISHNPKNQGAVGVFILNDQDLVSFLGTTPEGEGLIGTFKNNKPLVTLTSQNNNGRIQAWSKNGQTYTDIAPREESFKTGVVIPRVPLIDHPDESYALYLPQDYNTSRSYPVLFLFGTDGQGESLAHLVKDVAEMRRWIIVASNSYHGGVKTPLLIAEHLERDAHMRLSIERGRYYAAGFSWGGWLACWMAHTYRNFFSGVIPIGIPCLNRPREDLPQSMTLLKQIPHVHSYFLVGKDDAFLNENLFTHFNLKYVQKTLSTFKTYPGNHQLPDKDYLERAINDLSLSWLVNKQKFAPRVKDFMASHISLLVDEFTREQNIWEKFNRFAPIFPWTKRPDILSKETFALIQSAQKEFEKLKVHPELTKEIDAQKYIVANTIKDSDKDINIDEINAALDAYQAVRADHPNTEAAQLARQFKSVITRLKKNIDN